MDMQHNRLKRESSRKNDPFYITKFWKKYQLKYKTITLISTVLLSIKHFLFTFNQ